MSSGNRVIIRSVAESTYGTTPAAGTWQRMRYTSETLSGTPTVQTSNEVRDDRMIEDQYETGLQIDGVVNGEFSAGIYDEWIEAALGGTWATNVVKAGTDAHSFTLEKEFEDLGSNQFLVYTGERLASWDMNLVYGSAATVAFGFAGNGAAGSGTSAVGGGSETAATTDRIINTTSDVTNIDIDTVAFAGCLNSFTMNVNAGLRPQQCIGSSAPNDQLYGTCVITGTMEAYLDATIMSWYTTNVLNQTPMQVEFRLTDGTKHYDFNFPKLKMTGPSPQGGGLDTDTMITVNFTALWDSVEDTSLVITRTP